MFRHSASVHASCGAILHSRNQREECGHHPFGIADRYSGFARSERHRGRIHGLAFHLLRCRRTDGCLPHRHHQDTSGPPFQFPGDILRLDEIPVLLSQEIPPTTHRFATCRFFIRFLPCHVELSGFQNGAGTFLCGKQYHRYVRPLRHSRSTDGIIHRQIYTYSRSETAYLHRLYADYQCMDHPVCGAIQLCRHHSRYIIDRYRDAMHSA